MIGALTTFAWVGAAGMALGTVPPLYRLVADGENATYYATLVGITGIAAVAYAAMGLGVGTVQVDGRPVLLPRYVDWLLTTPLLVAYLGLLVEASRRTYAALVGVDVAVMGLGILAAFATGLLKFGAYAAGVLAYLGLVYLLVGTLPREADFDSSRVAATFTKLRNLTVVLWTLYPVVWLLGADALGLMTPTTTMTVVVYLDFISKVGFVAIAVRAADALADLGDESGAGDGAGGAAAPGD